MTPASAPDGILGRISAGANSSTCAGRAPRQQLAGQQRRHHHEARAAELLQRRRHRRRHRARKRPGCRLRPRRAESQQCLDAFLSYRYEYRLSCRQVSVPLSGTEQCLAHVCALLSVKTTESVPTSHILEPKA